MKVFVSYLTPLTQEFEVPDKFHALTVPLPQAKYEEFDRKFDGYVEWKIRPALEAKAGDWVDLCRIVDEDGNVLAEY
jgi:hypothetical protein